MSQLTLNPGMVAVPAGDKDIAVPRVPVAASRRKDEARARRRFSATRLGPAADDGFRLFRVY